VLASKNKDLLGKNLNPDRVNTNADTKDQKVENSARNPFTRDFTLLLRRLSSIVKN
jgi:methyl-accepting chemotaxis protein